MRRNQRSNGDARRRTGCWPCKNKHVRCTEERPQCVRCTRLGIQCQYGMKLLWQEDAVQRGIWLGREGAWSKHGKSKPEQQASAHHFVVPIKTPIFLHTAYRHFARLGEEDSDDGEEDQETRARETNQPIPTIALSHLDALSNIDAYLFNYFITAICPNCSLSPTNNPYLYYIAPMTFVFPPLHAAVISIAATERQLLNDRRFEKEAWVYKSRALQGLQDSIASGFVSWPFIATVLMLCFGDIADGCNDSWRTHLRGGLSLINDIRIDCTESQILRKFCLMYFVAHDIMGHTAGALGFESTPYKWLEDDCIDEIDPLMGCSRGLLDIINQISSISSSFSRIRSSRALTDGEMQCLSESRFKIERALQGVRQHPPASTANPTMAAIAETKRTTALLYLYERFDSISRSPSDPHLSETLPRHVSHLVKTLISQLEPLPATPTLLWPLFVLGNASPSNEEHRQFVLESLDEILKERNLGSVRLARRLVGRRFRNVDLRTCNYDAVDLMQEGSVAGIGGGGVMRGKWISLA
ncbi:hypothetical protein K458DRAFT_314478 [Lentithecium fluviatile CBS 122367]|uniref:Zn(2)-C6 fungal-type domain-containing protein n=1 Tax=Lentithecium fluviatile CBS 122367 TaxID=1168545 RepID=A0A6G1IN08_9PLEO|nr:hypothetical protein K458DRAFT_314478 [Lentithecium fluviatile CBS 122367]